MLVLSRKSHQRIRIGDRIFLEVVSVGHDKVKLAISAPEGIRIRRAELPAVSEFNAGLHESISEIPAPATNRR